MAQEWYLMNTAHDTVSGFESDDFDNFAADTFEEALDSSMGADVEICNYDLSIRDTKRVIVQGNVQDTKLNTLQRKMLAPIGTCTDMQYVFYKNRYWLIIGLVDDNGVYEKAVLALCNFCLSWENQRGDIIQRWANCLSASQYNNGETTDKYLHLRSDQLMISMAYDDECLLIPHNQRFIIDMRCRIYERDMPPDVSCDTSKPLITYELTRNDNVLYNYQDSGHFEFMATQDEQHEEDGYYLINDKGYWLCGKPKCFDESDDAPSCSIECDEPVIYVGLEQGVFIAKFVDGSGEEINVIPQWKINCDFAERLNVEYVDNSILISADDKKLVNKSFVLSLGADGYEGTSVAVTIRAFI